MRAPRGLLDEEIPQLIFLPFAFFRLRYNFEIINTYMGTTVTRSTITLAFHETLPSSCCICRSCFVNDRFLSLRPQF